MATVKTIPELENVEAHIRGLLTRNASWNGYNAPAPDAEAIEHATNWINTLYTDTSELGLPWLEPNVTASDDREVVLEWWKGAKKLTIYVGNESAEYVQVWGVDIDQDMAEGNADTREVRHWLWRWLADI